ncbi:very short patch repair endonuclease [Methylobacterium sp. E-041]|uniref:very short patch repair endonuclease n=1 Tax=Methylobacterium sp. E-041 TaxID=2836573 RepID=UPI001FB9A1DE|nr:very short patch repair endonuclease [Methylobacterium sp. E-041]MCJ2105397.1 very short patch repair endonuclease [Methylobacterium sp. E-041]
MGGSKSKDTKPELLVRQLLRQTGYGYRLHSKDLPGRPDIAFVGRRKATPVHGCICRQHEGCRRASEPNRTDTHKLGGIFHRDPPPRKIRHDDQGPEPPRPVDLRAIHLQPFAIRSRATPPQDPIKQCPVQTSYRDAAACLPAGPRPFPGSLQGPDRRRRVRRPERPP